MKKFLLQSGALLVLAVFTYCSARAQNIFVKLTDETGAVLTGASSYIGYVNQSEIESFGQESSSCEYTNPSCRAVTGNFVYNMLPDQTITDYRRALYLRKLWRKVEISFLRSSGSTSTSFVYEKITLEDVFVTGVQESTGAGNLPTVQISLDPVKLTWTFTSQLNNGQPGTSRTFTYNRQTNVGS